MREAPAARRADELIVTGTIKTYREGNRFLRGMLIGLGSAAFEGEVILKSGQAERVLFVAPFDKLWAWGGFLGMSKGIEEMWAEAAASVANTIARGQGLGADHPPDAGWVEPEGIEIGARAGSGVPMGPGVPHMRAGARVALHGLELGGEARSPLVRRGQDGRLAWSDLS